MRWVYLLIVILLLAAIIVFAAQNTESATVAFLIWSATAPLALIAFGGYVLGALTGGSLYALVRTSVRRSRGSAP